MHDGNLRYMKGGVFHDKTGKYYCLGGENCGPFPFKKVKAGKDLELFVVPGKHAD